jgi:hypothetical protein
MINQEQKTTYIIWRNKKGEWNDFDQISGTEEATPPMRPQGRGDEGIRKRVSGTWSQVQRLNWWNTSMHGRSSDRALRLALEGVKAEDRDDFGLLCLASCLLLLLAESIAAVPPHLASRHLVPLIDSTDRSTFHHASLLAHSGPAR